MRNVGPLLDLRDLHRLRGELENLRSFYAVARDELRATPSGKEKGMAGYRLSQIRKKGQAVAEKVAEMETEAAMRGILV